MTTKLPDMLAPRRTKARSTPKRGRLIAIEGMDGSGKSTASRGLAQVLGAEWTTTPGAALRACGLRELADKHLTDRTALHLFYAASVVEESGRIKALLAAGRDVVVDRWWLSTWAYAKVDGSPLDLAEVERHIVPADVTLWIDLSDDERCRRLYQRGMTDADRRTLNPTYANALRQLYLQGLRRRVAGHAMVLPVAGLSATQVIDQIAAAVLEHDLAA